MGALALAMIFAIVGPLGTASAAAPVGQGFTVTPSDLAFILKQIKIAEAHVRNTTDATGPCGALVGTGPDQIASPLVSQGLRTVDGSCNNLQPGQERFGAADEVFPRMSTPLFRDADNVPTGFGPPGPSTYKQTKGNVFDSEPRVVSNLIVDQTSTNPAAVAAAGNPVRSQGGDPVVPCNESGGPVGCVPPHETLFIPNVTTDVGLSPPYNSLFTLFGQFFDHGVDQTVKGGGTVFVPLKNDDPLIAGPDHIRGNGDDLPAQLRFMVLTRAKNQPGPDKVLGTADDVRDADNTDSPWVDQSQTYTSHASHQLFLREYARNTAGRPVSTGKLLGGPAGPTAGGMATWATVKSQAASLLGLRLQDKDVTDIPLMAVDPYGNFLPGPSGLPQYVVATGSATEPFELVEGNLANPVPVPANAVHFDTPFVTDIAHNADPTPVDTDRNPATPPVAPSPDSDTTASADFASQPVGTYDDEMLNLHFAAGDGRVNENIGLTAIHQVFHSEHDRLVDYIKSVLTNDTTTSGVAALKEWKLALGADGWNGERLFQAARFVTEMEYQHLVFEEFARKVQPAINPFEPFAFTQTELNPAVKAEFAHAVYRFGHSMLTETISRRNEDKPGPDGVFDTSDDIVGSQNDISLLDGFLNPPAYTDGGTAGPLTSEQAAGSIVMGMSDQTGSELDEFVTDTLRNNLLGLPLDLATVNLARARSEGVPPLNVFRRELFNKTNDSQLQPYTNWIDFGEHLKHPESLINFVAAYGKHPTITGATTAADKREAARKIVSPDILAGETPPGDAADFMNSVGAWANTGTSSNTGLDSVDLWVGGLAEVTNVFGGLLGSTFNYVFENQLTELQNGDRLYYLARTPGMNLRTQLEGNSFAELIMRNTNAHSLKADAFATADCKFELKNLAGTTAGFTQFGNTVNDDPASECKENLVLLRQADGTIQYRARNTVDPSGINGQSVFNGTPGVDRVTGGNDSDTFWGGLANDRIEGGDGGDVALGGEGNDVITDLAGDDVHKGGPGNDAIDAGPGLDIIMGGEGKDFTNGGANANETFGGEDDDFIMLGDSLDAAFGDSGDDYQEGGNQPDLMQGDSGNLFFLDDSQKPGSDILIGQGGDDDYDMEGGDDIGVGGPGVEKVAGASGYDWEIGIGDPQPQDMDLNIPLIPLDILQAGVRDKFNEVEALSGGDLNDILRGDDVTPSAVGGGGFIGCDALDQDGLNRIAGLDDIVPPLTTPLADVVATSASKDCPILTGPVWGDGNILLGGSGTDLLEGRGGNDILDGDRYLNVRLTFTDKAGVTRSTPVNQTGQSAMTSQYLRDGSGALTGPTLQQSVFAGDVDPGSIVAVKEVIPGSGGTDTAQFSDIAANYTVTTTGGNGTLGSPGSVTTVVHNDGGADGTDTLRNIERLVFSDTIRPGIPTIGPASPGIASATVRFTPSTVGSPTGFLVKVINAAGTQVGALRSASADATSLEVTGLTNGQTYRFQVAATNAVGTSAFSALSNAVTPRTEFTAPTVIARGPGSNRTSVDPAGNITATFSEAVTGVTTSSFTLSTASGGALVPASVTQGTGNQWILNPTANLASDTRYTATLSSAIADTQGNLLVGSSWSFTTGPAPTVTTVPFNGATGVPVANNITATFNENVQGVSGTTFTLMQGTTAVPATVTRNGTTNQWILNPSANLIPDRTYTATLTGGTAQIRDLAGNPLVTRTWTFMAGTAPTVTTRTPAVGARSVSQTGNITATFSEAVAGVSGTSFTLMQGTTAVPAAVSYNATTRVATLDPSSTLLPDRTYTAKLTGGAALIRDTAGNVLGTTSWTFTTGPAPTITATSPISGATGVRLSSNVTATFSEAITGVTATNVRLVRVSNGVAVSAPVATFNATSRVLTLNPSANLAANVQYRMTITGGAGEVRDLAGNPVAPRTWTFTTGSAV
ncbi:MAG TPA: Ig-like domain-containing protein [Propionibacteriaceae bacterium]|nr:Ig-like domain-containing protein [Propionibacteriaceae bacterium]